MRQGLSSAFICIFLSFILSVLFFRPTKRNKTTAEKRNGTADGKGAAFFIPEENENESLNVAL